MEINGSLLEENVGGVNDFESLKNVQDTEASTTGLWLLPNSVLQFDDWYDAAGHMASPVHHEHVASVAMLEHHVQIAP